MSLGFHSYWISVLSPTKQILIEFGYNPQELGRRRLFGSWLARKENPKYSPAQEIRKVFYCGECESWSITEDSLKRVRDEWDREAKASRETNSDL
jgi:hypothetical protein